MKYYRLKRGCCIEISITLCIRHLELRLKEGWGLVRDNGPDSQPCFDCNHPEGKV